MIVLWRQAEHRAEAVQAAAVLLMPQAVSVRAEQPTIMEPAAAVAGMAAVLPVFRVVQAAQAM